MATENQKVKVIQLKLPNQEEAAPGSDPHLSDSGAHVVTIVKPSLTENLFSNHDDWMMTCAVESVSSQCGI